ncbi:hypothetical protein HRM2_05650 [Desulforapulum autotrophicum HRM2]|uniref:Uncharacterized protein n=1 Tax=Desulforapulum autotrophicum (strain ATCC 43914 / DSM 3382 / VKM B-1955 / HRM2) TaxID=177437 RepID=C0QHX1_DESAH|nr:hypothetical protein HRM2_05650 [Desulforapulum autotrophicum HRM2]
MFDSLRIKFQSLLSWIRHSRPDISPAHQSVASFNPCCRGSGIPGGHPPAAPCDPAPGFQSLLSWIRHSRIVLSPWFVSDFPSFNPCCRGSGIPGIDQPRLTRHSKSFNPCCRGSGIPGIEASFGGMWLKSFNPCCRGSGIPGIPSVCVIP